MEPARFRSNVLGDGGGEGNHVVPDFRFDRVNAGHVNFAALADSFGGGGGNDAVLGERFAGGGFHFEPHLIFVFVAPDAAHFGAGITCDQANPPQVDSYFIVWRILSTCEEGTLHDEHRDNRPIHRAAGGGNGAAAAAIRRN